MPAVQREYQPRITSIITKWALGIIAKGGLIDIRALIQRGTLNRRGRSLDGGRR